MTKINLKRFDHPDTQMAVKANTVLKVLNAGSELSLIDILVRESIQNSLDAAIKNKDGYVTFSFDLIKFENNKKLSDKLRKLLKIGNDNGLFERMADRLKVGQPTIMVLSDKGTSGLSGPIDPKDKFWKDKSVRKNFANLVYELGQNHGADMAGGSYGFGKSVYYRISTAGLVLFYSRSIEGHRLAFCMISNDELDSNENSTGISWWGNTTTHNGNNYAIPITDELQIDAILSELELGAFKLKKDEFGTSIFIFSPLNELSDDDDDSNENFEAVDYMESIKNKFNLAVEKWYWPRMIETEKVRRHGTIMPLVYKSIGNKHLLTGNYLEKGKLLAAAEDILMSRPLKDSSINAIKITYGGEGVQRVVLGALAYQSFGEYNLSAASQNCKIAMIRAPRMVVYEQAIDIATRNVFNAIFLVNSEEVVFKCKKDRKENNTKVKLDNAYKKSESSTHSEWNEQNIPGSEELLVSYVRQTKVKVKNEIEKAISPSAQTGSQTSDWASYSTILGKALLTDDEGFVNPEFTKRRGGGALGRGNKKPSFDIYEQNFGPNGEILFKIKFKNLSSKKYNLLLIARGSGGSTFSHEQWKKRLGNEFPFYIKNVRSRNFSVLDHNRSSVAFMGKSENLWDWHLEVIINATRKDSLIGFELVSE